MKKWSWARFDCCWSRLLLLGMVVIVLSIHAVAAHAFGSTQCAGSRFGSNLGCTANDVQLNSITIAGTPPASCVGGSTLPLDLNVTINFGSSTRYDVGVFLSNNGQDPSLTSASSCSVAVLPTSSPFWGSVASGGDGDLCGDGGNNLTDGFPMTGVAVPCITDGSGNFTLYIPYVISWDQQSTNYCGDNTYPVPGTTSKCNKGTVSFPPGTSIVVLPTITITDGVTTAKSGDTLTYTVVITNTTGSSLSGAVFTDPAVANLSVSSVSCAAAGGATCPASPTVSAMQGAGIVLPNMPINSSLTFTVIGTVGAVTTPTTLTNTAKVTFSGQTNSASDSDTLVAPPTVTKSFSPSVIAVGGTSTLTFTLANPNALAINGVAFVDVYPAGMANTLLPLPVATTTCGGIATALPLLSTATLAGATIPANGSCTVTVKYVTASITGNNSVNVTSSNASTGTGSGTLYVAKTMTLVASPATVPNDGTTPSVVTATITDTAGNAVPGDNVSLSCTGNANVTPASGTTNASGQMSFAVTDTYIETVTCTATDSTGLSKQVQVTFSTISGFNAFESATAAGAVAGPIYTKLAGAAFGLDVVAVAGSSQASGFNNNVKVELLANTGTAGSGYGADNCPTSNSVIQTIASAAIASGRSTVNFPAVANAYQDVRVRISYPTTSPTIVICSNDSFAIRPSALTLHTDANAAAPSASATPVIKAGSAFTLYATTGSGTNYGGTLTLDGTKLTAQTVSQDTIVQSGGVVGTLLPSTLAVNPASVPSNNASYTEVGYLYLGAGAYRDDTFTSVDQPNDCISGSSDDVFASGKIGCLIGNYTAVSLGRFIPDHFALTTRGTIIVGSNSLVVDSAAGISVGMTLAVAGAGVAGASLTSTVTAVAGTTITLSLSAAASVVNASVVLSSLQTRGDLAATGSSFTYMDEPMKLSFNVIACNSAEGVTQNYAGIFSKLGAAALGTGSNWFNTGCTGASQCFGLGAVNGATGLSGRLSIDTSVANPASLWATGVGTFVAYMKFNRNATPDGPYQALKIGAMPRDGDGVTLPDPTSSDAHKVDLDATTGNTLASNPDGTNERRLLFTTDVRFGRLWIGNAYGPEQRDLTIPFEAQYWNGNTFIKNTADSLTSIAKANIGLGNHLPSGFSASVDLTHIPAGPFPVVSGSGSFTLIKPSGSPLSGSVDIVFDMGATTTTNTSWTPSQPPTAGANMGYLRGKWSGAAYDRDPTARATFGIFGNSLKKGPIYLRENY